MPRKKTREVTPTQINEKALKEKMRKIKKNSELRPGCQPFWLVERLSPRTLSELLAHILYRSVSGVLGDLED